MPLDSPERAVQDYINSLASNPDGASTLPQGATVSPYVKPKKRDEIQARLGHYIQLLEAPGSRAIVDAEILPAEYSDQFKELATVSVLLHQRDDELQYAILPFAVIKRDGHWLVSLTPASFDNAGLPYDANLRNAAKELEKVGRTHASERAAQRLNASLKSMAEQVRMKRESYANLSYEELQSTLYEAAEAKDTLTLASLLWPCFAADRPIIDKTDEQRLALTLAHLRRFSRSPMKLSGIQLPLLCDPGVVLFPLPQEENNNTPIYPIGGFSFETYSLRSFPSGAGFFKIGFFPVTGADGLPALGFYSRYPLQVEKTQWDADLIEAFYRVHPQALFESAEEGATQVLQWLVDGNAAELMRHMSPQAFSSEESARTNAVFLRVLMISAQKHLRTQRVDLSSPNSWLLFNPHSPRPTEASLTPSPDGQSVIVTATSPNEYAINQQIAFELKRTDSPQPGWFLNYSGPSISEEKGSCPSWNVDGSSKTLDVDLQMMPTVPNLPSTSSIN
jgi:hypothetical protein